MYQLERYNGKNRYQCPNCGANREFVRYVDENGDFLSIEVGRCNREVKCGYHYKPREYFADNPGSKGKKAFDKKSKIIELGKKTQISKRVDFISQIELQKTIGSYERNCFVKFLLKHFSLSDVQKSVQKYFVGTWTDDHTVFWQIDSQFQIRTGKLIAYDRVTGKRSKTINPSWVHAELKRNKSLPEDFALEQCLFGEHLLKTDLNESVGIVESEKTAIIASLFVPNVIWLATGGSKNLRLERVLKNARNRKIVLFPDSSQFSAWNAKADEAKLKFNLKVSISDLLETSLSEEEKSEDRDLADLLLANRQRQSLVV